MARNGLGRGYRHWLGSGVGGGTEHRRRDEGDVLSVCAQVERLRTPFAGGRPLKALPRAGRQVHDIDARARRKRRHRTVTRDASEEARAGIPRVVRNGARAVHVRIEREQRLPSRAAPLAQLRGRTHLHGVLDVYAPTFNQPSAPHRPSATTPVLVVRTTRPSETIGSDQTAAPTATSASTAPSTTLAAQTWPALVPKYATSFALVMSDGPSWP